MVPEVFETSVPLTSTFFVNTVPPLGSVTEIPSIKLTVSPTIVEVVSIVDTIVGVVSSGSGFIISQSGEISLSVNFIWLAWALISPLNVVLDIVESAKLKSAQI